MDKRDGMIGVVALLVGGLGIKLIKERRYRNYLVNKFGDRNAESFSADYDDDYENAGWVKTDTQFQPVCSKCREPNDYSVLTRGLCKNCVKGMNAESFSADSISICGICSVAGHPHCGQTTGCPCCEIRVKKESQRPTCGDCGKLKSSTPQEYNQWTCWPCVDRAGGSYHGTECYCSQCMSYENYAESFEAGTYTDRDGEVHEIPDFLDPDYCRVIGSGKYRFNHYDRYRKAWRQYRFKTKDEAMEYLSGWTLPLGMVNPGQDQYDFPQKQAESFSADHSWIELPSPDEVLPVNSIWRNGKHWKCNYCHEIKHTAKGKPHTKGCDVGYVDWDNMEWQAESHAYSYAYNEGHSDSRKREEYRPNLSSARQEGDFKKILKQKGD